MILSECKQNRHLKFCYCCSLLRSLGFQIYDGEFRYFYNYNNNNNSPEFYSDTNIKLKLFSIDTIKNNHFLIDFNYKVYGDDFDTY